MKRMLVTASVVCALLASIVLSVGGTAQSDMDATPDGGTPMPMTGMGAAYLTIANAGTEPDRLVGAKTDVAQVVEIHEVVDEGGVKQMRPLEGGLEIPAGGTVELKPGGFHLMLVGLNEDLTPGMTYDLTLTFEKTGEVTIMVTVRVSAEAPADATPVPPVTAGDLTVTNVWSRPAPALGDMASPMASPMGGMEGM
jgi:copper(I)-binding protein